MIAFRTGIVLSVLVLVGSLFVLPSSVFACSAGEHEATASDVPLMIQAGIKNAVVGMCWNSNDQAVGQTDAQAKQYLKSILCKPDGDNYGGMGSDGTVDKLDSKFAVCASSFLKSAAQSGIPVCLKEGVRSVAKQEQYAARYKAGGSIACTKGASCEHPRGIAIDVNTNTEANYQKLHTSAPSFGLTFYLGFRDKVHFVPMKGGCSAGGTVPTDGTIPPTYYDFPQYYTLPNSSLPFSPTMPFTSAVPSLMNAAMSPSASPSASPAQSPSSSAASPQICTPQFSCTASIMYYQTSSCTTQTYQVCPNGCNGTSCAAATSSASTGVGGAFTSTTTSGSTSPSSNSDSSSSSTPVSDILSQITGYTFSAVDIATSSSLAFQLDPSTGDVAQIGGTNIHPGNAIASNTIYSIQPTGAQQTFTSSDLSGSGTFNPQPSQTTGLQSVLNGMRAALTWALGVLKTL